MLVHCKGGHGRSAAVVMAWLMSEGGGGLNPAEAQHVFVHTPCGTRRCTSRQTFSSTTGGGLMRPPASSAGGKPNRNFRIYT